MNSITVAAPAKINLTLDVKARRADGYHDIRSVMQTIGLHDTLTVTRTPETPGVRLEVFGDEAAGVPSDASNLVHRAAIQLQKIAGGGAAGLHIHLEKHIPSQAGLGGGSSDAAATLRAVNKLFALNLSLNRLTALATELGSDVPFFLTGGTARVEGLGERVTPLPLLNPAWSLVIVKPAIGVSTRWAYDALDALPGRAPGEATEAWLRGHQQVTNDFEAVTLSLIEIGNAWQMLKDAPERVTETPPLLCGSGSALFCRTLNHEAGVRLVERVRQTDIGKAWVTQTVGDEN